MRTEEHSDAGGAAIDILLPARDQRAAVDAARGDRFNAARVDRDRIGCATGGHHQAAQELRAGRFAAGLEDLCAAAQDRGAAGRAAGIDKFIPAAVDRGAAGRAGYELETSVVNRGADGRASR